MNHLKNETSPYLLQHVDNPVDWYPWGAEALEKAKSEDKPILLSIGYSACHWCHVMAHESFEDEATAQMMNAHFVNIKVDREERPDLDDIYMKATQIFQRGHGGWPMTVFLTPDGRPFHAGTYYPPTPRHGMPSFRQIMQGVMDAYTTRRDEVEQSAEQVANMLQSEAVVMPTVETSSAFTESLLEQSAQKLIAGADSVHGGLHTGAPKFPSPMNLDFLLRTYAHNGDKTLLETALFTLEKMARGGIYDQLGYGFHRYSVDQYWLVPHFEKMLYDNAQLARVYLHAFQLSGDDFYATICRQILDYVEREMLDESGGFYSTQDADSEGEEGKFFVWESEEFEAVLEPHFDDNVVEALMAYWDVTLSGNFEGSNILHVDVWAEDIAHDYDLKGADMLAHVEKARELLFTEREKRVKPGRDEKMLAAWNGMMLAAYAEAARVFGDEHYRQIAERNADFLLTKLSSESGALYRTHKDGISKLNGYLEDYALVIDGLLELYQTTFETRWFDEAQRLTDYVLAHFRADDGGGFFDTGDEHETLVARPRSLQDSATPSGNSQMAFNLIRMSAYTGQPEYGDAALAIFQQTLAAVQQYPSAFGMVLNALDLYVRRPVEVAIVGGMDESRAVLDALQKAFRPRLIAALAPEDQGEKASPMLLAYRTRRDDAPTVYVCQNFACAAPVNTVDEVRELLSRA